MKKIIILAFVAVVILVGGYAVYAKYSSSWSFLWKTYTDTQYGFEIKYPAGWNIVKSPNYYGGGIVAAGETPYAIEYENGAKTIADVKAAIFYVGKDFNGDNYVYPTKSGLFSSGKSYDPSLRVRVQQIFSTFKFTK